MFVSRDCLTAILENLSVLNRESGQLEKRITEVEERTQGQQRDKKNSLITLYGDNEICHQELRIFLSGHDLCELQKQPFYQELKKYFCI